jgi:putative AlgH/UPF0301 family transcriptional regulator
MMAISPHNQESPDGVLLSRMQEQDMFATLIDHMLINGILYRRCPVCRCGPIPRNAGSVLWCDDCIDDALSGTESLSDFINRKRKVPDGR